jgi:hypothetical protein
MSNSKPVITTNSRNDYSSNYKRYDTYRELKKHIKEHLDICIETRNSLSYKER